MTRMLVLIFALVLPLSARASTIPGDLTLIDQRGETVQLSTLFDRPLVLAPVYYRCPNLCSATLASLMQLVSQAAALPGADYRIIAYSIDPAEGPAQAEEAWQAARGYLTRPTQDPDVRFLTGAAETIKALSSAIGFQYQWDDKTQQFNHPAYFAVAGSNGVIARWLPALGADANDLDLALTEASRGAIGDLGSRLLLYCYHYDPQTGRYRSLVGPMMTGGGLLTLALLGGYIGVSLWRERRA